MVPDTAVPKFEHKLWRALSMNLSRLRGAIGRPLCRAHGRRWIGEQTGLSAIADRTDAVRRHDALSGTASGETQVDAYARWGFTVNGVALVGSVLLLPKASFLFSPRNIGALTPESLRALELLDTPMSMVVVGCGRRSQRMPSQVREWFEARGTAVEAVATPHACSTFNFMIQEQRDVAAILFPLDAD